MSNSVVKAVLLFIVFTLSIVVGDMVQVSLFAADDRGKAGEVKKIGNMEFVYIPSGSFLMGTNDFENEKPVHKVTLAGFWLGKYEVTQKQYEEIMGKNPSQYKGSDKPVEQVSWDDAVKFSKKFSNKYKVKARLPYEAEWEYACRAGTVTKYYWGSNMNDAYLWYLMNSESTTHAVGTKKPNAWGLYDMIGNVWEWCIDWYDDEYYKASPAENPLGPTKGKFRVIRGGSWFNVDKVMYSGHRKWFNPKGSLIVGFRVIVSEK